MLSLKWPLILVFLALGISHGLDKKTIFAAWSPSKGKHSK